MPPSRVTPMRAIGIEVDARDVASSAGLMALEQEVTVSYSYDPGQRPSGLSAPGTCSCPVRVSRPPSPYQAPVSDHPFFISSRTASPSPRPVLECRSMALHDGDLRQFQPEARGLGDAGGLRLRPGTRRPVRRRCLVNRVRRARWPAGQRHLRRLVDPSSERFVMRSSFSLAPQTYEPPAGDQPAMRRRAGEGFVTIAGTDQRRPAGRADDRSVKVGERVPPSALVVPLLCAVHPLLH